MLIWWILGMVPQKFSNELASGGFLCPPRVRAQLHGELEG